MKTLFVFRRRLLLGLAVFLCAIQAPAAENVLDEAEIVRSVYAADREEFVAKAMQLTETESAPFWPLYREYQTRRKQLGDEMVKLVLEYADAHPEMPDDRSRQLLKNYSSLENRLAKHRATYLKKFSRVLPPGKALRFAQLENRLDLALRLQLASAIPLVPTNKTP